MSVCLLPGMLPAVQAQHSNVYVDTEGVMRWQDSHAEVQAFGVNYTAMFAHGYRMAQARGVSVEEVIDQDIYHFTRLGFDAFRVHVWDVEISDTLGNVLANEHLRLFDYALARMKARGMQFVITPIAYWGNGYPEPDEATPGFSNKYGKDACLTHADAIRAQERYLYQFLNHVNPYTGVAYKAEPAILAFEISNEPHHHGTAKEVTAFINRMVKSMRSTGCKKPIFYNMSHSIHLADAYLKAKVDGGTFQWYPTGLVSHHALGGNLLPNVDRYTIPFANQPAFQKRGKLVYEFDAADVAGSYLYPAMARSFRQAGLQVATQFAYDPMVTADVNTEYNTHYMNLVYAPQKALSLMIAGEVFHTMPLYKDYGRYPQDTVFGPFHVSAAQDLAEMVTDTKFLYTNHTHSQPPAPDRLQQIAGYGNSSVVQYAGTGAYFLDQLAPGVWRLEVLPDALWLQDPFGYNSPQKQVAAVNWRRWPITVALPDLGAGFSVRALNAGNTYHTQATASGVNITPGTYLLTRAGITTSLTAQDVWQHITLGEFVAPATNLPHTIVRHTPPPAVTSGTAVTLTASVFTPAPPQAVTLSLFPAGWWKPLILPMKPEAAYTYSVTLPDSLLQTGYLTYHLTVETSDGIETFPSHLNRRPGDWDFYTNDPATDAYTLRVLPPVAPIYLWQAYEDAAQLAYPWTPGAKLIPEAAPHQALWQVVLDSVPQQRYAGGAHDYSLRAYVGNKLQHRTAAVAQASKLTIYGRSATGKPAVMQVALVMQNGVAYSALVTLGATMEAHTMALKDLKPVPVVTLPRPYPDFLPYFFERPATAFQLEDVEAIQFSIGPGLAVEAGKMIQGIAIEGVYVE